ncbi:MAG: hypothetical protein ACC726_14185, partial [Chloroflexota bacterium]
MGITAGDGPTERAATRTAEAISGQSVVQWSAGTAGMLVPFNIDPGCVVLEIGVGNGDLTQALAERGALVNALEADADAAQQAGRRSAGLELVQVEHLTFSAWLKSRGSTKRSFDLILYREDQTSSGQGTADLELVVEAATGLLRPSGTLLLAIGNPWGLRAMLGSFASDSGSSRAMLQALLNRHGFTEQRWLLPYPDSRAPAVIVDTELLARPIGTSLTEMLVRHPVAAPNVGDLFVTDPLKAFQSAVRAGLAADVADVFLISATRHGQVDDVTRNGRMWLVPPLDISATWQRPRELLEIGDRWLFHPLGSYEGISSGPLRLAPVTIEAPAGKSGEDVLVEALIGPGPFAAVTQGLVRAWWNAARSVIAQAEPGQHPLDLRPRHFAVDESGDWTYITQDLSFRFQVPPETLALAAMAHTIVEAVLPRGWMRGLEPSMTVAESACFLLDTIGVSCGDEHVMLWLSLEADIRVRIGGSGIDHEASRLVVREFSETTIGSMLDRLPLAARIAAGVADTRPAAEAEARRSEIAQLRTARDAAAEGKMRAELESERLRGVVSRLRAELGST